MSYSKILQFARDNRKNATRAENFFWQKVRNRRFYKLKFSRQYIIEHESRSYFIADFHCHEYSLIVEIDGAIHRQQQDYDKLREDILEAMGFQIIRFTNEQVLNDWESVETKLIQFLSVD